MSAELLLHESQEHTKQLEKDAEHIRALARIAELRHERLVRLETCQSKQFKLMSPLVVPAST